MKSSVKIKRILNWAWIANNSLFEFPEIVFEKWQPLQRNNIENDINSQRLSMFFESESTGELAICECNR